MLSGLTNFLCALLTITTVAPKEQPVASSHDKTIGKAEIITKNGDAINYISRAKESVKEGTCLQI